MNYRHAYHAGNFADLLKHVVLSILLRSLTETRSALTVIDSHAGAGLYDLQGDEARRTREAESGIGRLMIARNEPEVFRDLKSVIMRFNREKELRFYPGSPLIVRELIRSCDRYIGCELRSEEFTALESSMSVSHGVTLLRDDGWRVATERSPARPDKVLLLVDPPYERGDDAERVVEVSRQVLGRNPGAVIAVWAPIKDLASFDRLLMEFFDATAPAPVVVAEVRLRSLNDPMAMNGCAMIIANPTQGLDVQAADAATWIARNLGDASGLGRVERMKH